MKKQNSVHTETTTIIEEKVKTWEQRETTKKTIKLEKPQPVDEKPASDDISPDKCWRQKNIWIIIES